jgi:RNA polymerase sigma-70 factor (ECF subfamily)
MQDSEETGIDVEAFYVRYGPMVLRRCRKLLKNEEKAMDAMQDVFTKVLLNQNRLHSTYPSSLLFRMATNVCLNMIRKEKSHKEIYDDDILTNIAMFDENEEKLIFNNVLDRIFKREKTSTRQIAVMHYVDGMTLNEVAKEVGLSVSGVRKRLRELRGKVNINGGLHDR